jgi:FkbH-like protein
MERVTADRTPFRLATPAADAPHTPPLSPTADHRRLRAALNSIRRQEDRILDRWYANQFERDRLERFELEYAKSFDRHDALEHVLRPMLRLLLAYLESGDERYRDVYLDERLRCAPHRADPKTRRSFFAELLPADVDAILASVGSEESRDAFRVALAAIHAPLVEAASKDAIKLLAVGDCVLNEVRVFLRSRAAVKTISLDVRNVYFSAAMGKELSASDVEGAMADTRYDVVAFSFFTYEGLPPYTALLREADQLSAEQIEARVQSLLSLVEQYLTKLRADTDAPFLLHNVSGLPLTRYRKYLPFLATLSRGRRAVVDQLNQGLRQMADGIPNVLLLDEHAAANRFGVRKATQPAVPRRMLRGALFHTARFGEPLADAYLEVLASFRDLRKAKVLFLDFDNTLWDGVMADGIVRHRIEAQRLLRKLKDAGMLLVALSKNDPKNVRWDEMILKPEDFVSLKISWNLKVQSLKEAAVDLDLGLDSFVVIDDSAQERDFITSQLPTVKALDSLDPATWASLERLLRFPNTKETEESRARTQMYRAQAERRREQAEATDVDYPSMMATLGLRLRFGKATVRDLERLAELVQRTNQFNTTTQRYTKNELAAFINSAERGVYVADVTDKFGSFGLVATIIVKRSADELTIDSFVMSCRAMGFGLEQGFLRLVLDAESPARRIVGRFIPSDRNEPSARVFVDNGFRAVDETNWELTSAEHKPTIPAWIQVEAR